MQLIVMSQLFLKTHIRPFMMTIVCIVSQRLRKFSDKIFTRFTVLRTSQLYKNNIKYYDYNLDVCGKRKSKFVDGVSFFVDL